MGVRGGIRGRGRGAAGSRGAGGVGRGYMPGYMRGGGGGYKKYAPDVSTYNHTLTFTFLPARTLK